MIKLNDINTASVNVLAESELDQVTGGCGRGRRGGGRGYGGGGSKHGYDKGGYDKGGYDKRDHDRGGYEDSYEPSYGSDGSSGDDVRVNNQNITLDININQVAG